MIKNENKKRLFESIITDKYNTIKYKIGCKFSFDKSSDILHTIICKFYEKDFANFNMNYNSIDYSTNEGYKLIKKIATCYFLKSIYKYLSPKNFYYKKLTDIEYDSKIDKSVHRDVNNLFYSNIVDDHSVLSSQIFRFVLLGFINTEYDNTNIIYINQFKHYILSCSALNLNIKAKLIYFFTYYDKSVFKTNFYYYKKLIKKLLECFNLGIKYANG